MPYNVLPVCELGAARLPKAKRRMAFSASGKICEGVRGRDHISYCRTDIGTVPLSLILGISLA